MLNNIKKKYQEFRRLLAPHPLFRVVDKFKLSEIKRGTDKKGFILLKPKGLRHNIKIRKNFTDREVVHYVFQDQYHLPPQSAKMSKNPVILDLGSNIGLTLVHMKQMYPTAQIIGYEMNKENFKIAERNVKFYQDISINNKAVWVENTTVSYKVNSSYDSYSILNNQVSKENNEQIIEVESISIPSIIKVHNLTRIDYLKMDIEGAEEAILQSDDLSWLDLVNALNIEMHLEKAEDINKYIKIIENKGFKAWKDDKHWSSIFAVKV